MKVQPRAVLSILAALMLPVTVLGQTAVSGTITGVARDSSGSVLPGVTVEAASNALIEKMRYAVTDAQGLYRIVDLRPGVYKVTFSLPGFSTFVRDGIELQTAFAATVNAEMAVGTIEETITVSGQASLVDTQNVMTREVFTKKEIDTLPVATNTGMYATLIPGAKVPVGGATVGGIDVGGTQSERSTGQFTVHGGSTDFKIVQDGVEYGWGVYSINRLNTQEVNVQTAAITAESETGGVRMNVVPREGGNRFSGNFAVDGSSGGLQSENIGDDLRARGVTGSPYVKRLYNMGAGVGGPIKQDKVWFYGVFRKWETQQWLPGKYWNATQGTPVYTPDPSRPAHSLDYFTSYSGRVTWQATTKNKISFGYEQQENCLCIIRLIAENRAPEATANHVFPLKIPQVAWNYPASNRLLFEAGAGWYISVRDNQPIEGVSPNDISIRELSTDFRYNARGDNTGGGAAYGKADLQRNNIQRFAASYVTSTHNFKTGVFVQQYPNRSLLYVNGGVQYNFRDGRPISILQFASPDGRNDLGHNLGVFVQDQWTVKRATMNLGLRFDHYRAYSRAFDVPAGPFIAARSYPETDDLQNFKDLNPRLGGAYDLFGNGKTAVKGFLGRYIIARAGGTGNANPAAQVVNSATRTWTDINRDFVPQENELGPLSNNQFGNPVARNITVADDVSFGFGNRDHTWQGSVSIQHELRQGLAVNVGYFRTWYGNLTYMDNLLVTPADFDEYCITAPVDPRLPGGGGNQICGLYDVKPAFQGQVQNYQDLAGDKRTRVFDGVDMTVNARIGRALIAGGVAMGQTVIDECGAAVDSPMSLRFCRDELGWSEDVQVKIHGSYELPWRLQTSATYQSLAGIPITANYLASGAEIARGLGRIPSAGPTATANVALIEPDTMYEKRPNLVDLRFSRRFSFGGMSVTGNFDVYNLFNAAPITAINTQYGPAWLNVNDVTSARLIKFGMQLEF